MKDENCYWGRYSIIFSFAVPVGLALFALLAPSQIAAQGTPEQRAACEDEARWLCSNYIPDVEAIKGCMVRNRAHLSPRCRKMFSRDAKRQTGH
jgi:hypothetical protein